jgi:hypothetical protein
LQLTSPSSFLSSHGSKSQNHSTPLFFTHAMIPRFSHPSIAFFCHPPKNSMDWFTGKSEPDTVVFPMKVIWGFPVKFPNKTNPLTIGNPPLDG